MFPTVLSAIKNFRNKKEFELTTIIFGVTVLVVYFSNKKEKVTAKGSNELGVESIQSTIHQYDSNDAATFGSG